MTIAWSSFVVDETINEFIEPEWWPFAVDNPGNCNDVMKNFLTLYTYFAVAVAIHKWLRSGHEFKQWYVFEY